MQTYTYLYSLQSVLCCFNTHLVNKYHEGQAHALQSKDRAKRRANMWLNYSKEFDFVSLLLIGC